MAQGGILGKGVKVFYGTGTSPSSWTEIEQILEATPPSRTSDRHEVTTHNEDDYDKVYMSGLSDVPDPTLKLLADWDSATTPSHAALSTFCDDRTIIWTRWEIPQSPDLDTTLYKVMQFKCDVGSETIETPINGPQTVTYTFRKRGALTRSTNQASMS